jgi:hypothetical protein
MNAIRQIKEVKAGAVTIDLPDGFSAKKVEIFILPSDDTNGDEQSLQDLLLDAPTITDDELQEFNRVRDWMSQWKLETFG